MGRLVDLFLIGPKQKIKTKSELQTKYPQWAHFHFTRLLFSGLKLSQSVHPLFRHIYQFVCSADVAGWVTGWLTAWLTGQLTNWQTIHTYSLSLLTASCPDFVYFRWSKPLSIYEKFCTKFVRPSLIKPGSESICQPDVHFLYCFRQHIFSLVCLFWIKLQMSFLKWSIPGQNNL